MQVLYLMLFDIIISTEPTSIVVIEIRLTAQYWEIKIVLQYFNVL